MIRISGSFFASAAPAIETKPRAKQINPLATEIRPTSRREAFPLVVAVWRTGSTSYGPAIIAVYPDNKIASLNSRYPFYLTYSTDGESISFRGRTGWETCT
jgi:hypothetical protein